MQTQTDYRQALTGFLAAQSLPWAVTAAFNGGTSLASGRSALRAFHARLDRAFLGRNWSKMPVAERAFAVWAPEHVQSNLHYHGMIRVPADKAEQFLEKGPRLWAEIIPSGSMDIKPVHNAAGWANYFTKESTSDWFFSSDF